MRILLLGRGVDDTMFFAKTKCIVPEWCSSDFACLGVRGMFSEYFVENALYYYEFRSIDSEIFRAPKTQASANGGWAMKSIVDGEGTRTQRSRVAWRRTIFGRLKRDLGEIGTPAVVDLRVFQ